MSCFEQAVTKVLEHEGGFSDNEADPGGATNFGISLRWLKSVGLYGDLDDDGDVDVDDIKAIDNEVATRMYRKWFWDKHEYFRIKDCAIATKVFDMTVNMGPYRAARIVQHSINTLGGNLRTDGDIGPNTFKAINTEDADTLLDEIRMEQKRFYLSLISKRPSLAVFRKGWLRRAMA